MVKGWFGHPMKHSLASKGVKTSISKSRDRPTWLKFREKYYCPECGRFHRTSSVIGKNHREYSNRHIREVITSLNEWLSNVDYYIDSNADEYGPYKDESFMIFYEDGSTKFVDVYSYDGERISLTNVENILFQTPDCTIDFTGEVDVDDEFFKEVKN